MKSQQLLFLNAVKKGLKSGNKTWTAVIVGKRRQGKSWAALRLAEYLDENFSIANVVFTAQDAISFIRREDIQHGSVLIFDEGGTGMSSREFWSEQNKSVLNVLQTFGYKNLGLIITVPHFSYLDSGCRKMIDCYVKIVSRTKEHSFAQIYSCEVNEFKDKPYYPRFNSKNKYGHNVDVNGIWIQAPSVELSDAYEELARTAKDKLISDEKINIDSNEAENRKRKWSPELYVSDLNTRPDREKFFGRGGGFNKQYFEAVYDVGARTSEKVRAILTSHKLRLSRERKMSAALGGAANISIQ